MKIFLGAIGLVLALATSAWAQTQTQVWNLAWTDNSSGARQEDGFRVERRLGQTGSFAVVGQVGTDVTKFVDTLSADPGGTEYCYRVVAFNKAGNSGYSNIACATSPVIQLPPNAPTVLTVQ